MAIIVPSSSVKVAPNTPPPIPRSAFIKALFKQPQKLDSVTLLLAGLMAGLVIIIGIMLFDSGLGQYKGTVLTADDDSEIKTASFNRDTDNVLRSKDNHSVYSALESYTELHENAENSRLDAHLTDKLMTPERVGKTWFLDRSRPEGFAANEQLTASEQLFNISQR